MKDDETCAYLDTLHVHKLGQDLSICARVCKSAKNFISLRITLRAKQPFFKKLPALRVSVGQRDLLETNFVQLSVVAVIDTSPIILISSDIAEHDEDVEAAACRMFLLTHYSSRLEVLALMLHVQSVEVRLASVEIHVHFALLVDYEVGRRERCAVRHHHDPPRAGRARERPGADQCLQ